MAFIRALCGFAWFFAFLGTLVAGVIPAGLLALGVVAALHGDMTAAPLALLAAGVTGLLYWGSAHGLRIWAEALSSWQ